MTFPQNSQLSKTYNIEAEQVVLGCLMSHDTSRQLRRIAFLEKAHFYEPIHQMIFQEIQNIVMEGNDANPIIVQRRMHDDLRVLFPANPDEGLRYIARIMVLSSSILNIKQFAKEVSGLAKLRKAQGIMEDMGTLTSENVDELLASVNLKVNEIFLEKLEAQIIAGDKLRLLIVEDMQKELPRYSTGIMALDQVMAGGLYECRSYCIAAKAKMGKTTLLSSISYNLDKSGVKHLFIAAEMGIKQIHQRNLARSLGINSIAFLNSKKSSDFVLKVAESKAGENTFFVDTPGINFVKLQEVVKNAIETKQISGFFLDYIQLVEGKEKGQSDAEHIKNVAQWIANTCKEHGIWCVYAAQINRDGDIYGSDGVIKAADQVYNLNTKYDKITDSHKVWLDMMVSRYTLQSHVGSEHDPIIALDSKGPFYRDI